MGLEVLAISAVSNLAAGLGAAPLHHQEVLATGQLVNHQLIRLFERLVPRISALIASDLVREAHR
jgi:purine nucleoside phosphorylase